MIAEKFDRLHYGDETDIEIDPRSIAAPPVFPETTESPRVSDAIYDPQVAYAYATNRRREIQAALERMSDRSL